MALNELKNLTSGSLVLDPMSGSGTVLREAIELRHTAVGFDLDPLAVLMARVWTTPISVTRLDDLTVKLTNIVEGLNVGDLHLPWIDTNPENDAFVRYWFGSDQRRDLRKLVVGIRALATAEESLDAIPELDVLRLALSRIIVTKDRGASLARDVSHSRPHKVEERSDYQVIPAFERSVRVIRKRLQEEPPPNASARVALGDARSLSDVEDSSVDAILTSPPYLNAIDYLRGHRLALIWLGHSLRDLREVRAESIGAERGEKGPLSAAERIVKAAIADTDKLPGRHAGMVGRYAGDLLKMMRQAHRVLRPSGSATFVIGDSCLKGVFISNSEAIVRAAAAVGFSLRNRSERELPMRHRYLPIPEAGALGKRMRTESVLTFVVG